MVNNKCSAKKFCLSQCPFVPKETKIDSIIGARWQHTTLTLRTSRSNYVLQKDQEISAKFRNNPQLNQSTPYNFASFTNFINTWTLICKSYRFQYRPENSPNFTINLASTSATESAAVYLLCRCKMKVRKIVVFLFYQYQRISRHWYNLPRRKRICFPSFEHQSR